MRRPETGNKKLLQTEFSIALRDKSVSQKQFQHLKNLSYKIRGIFNKQLTENHHHRH